MRFLIVCPDPEGAKELTWPCRHLLQVEVIQEKFENVPHFDCVATAGNSFGLKFLFSLAEARRRESLVRLNLALQG